MHKIQKISSFLLFFVYLFLLTLPVIFVLDVIHPSSFPSLTTNIVDLFGLLTLQKDMTRFAGIVINVQSWTPVMTLLKSIADAVFLMPYAIGLLVFRKILQTYKQGKVFCLENALRYKTLAWLVFLNAGLFLPLYTFLTALALTWNNPVGHRYFVIAVSVQPMALLTGVMLVMLSLLMVEASKLQEEQMLVV